MIDLHGATLPEGWKVEALRPEILVIERVAPAANWNGGYVTICFKQRIFDAGSGHPYKNRGGQYTGRNWQKKIIKDACAWLEKSMT